MKNIPLEFMKLILVFINIMKKQIQADKNVCKYILFRIDIYFSECFLSVEIDEKGHIDRDIIFEEKRQKVLEKKLGCKFIRININNAKKKKEKEMREKLKKGMREKVEKELKDKRQ